MDGDVLVPIFGIIGVFGSTAFVAWVILEGFRSRQRTRLTSEFHHKLLDRVSSAQDLGALLNSPGGEKLVASLSIPHSDPHSRILRAAQTGLVLLSLGVGLFMTTWWTPTIPAEGHDSLNVCGAIATSLGVGLLLSAAVSYVLSKRMGLFDDDRNRHRLDSLRSA